MYLNRTGQRKLAGLHSMQRRRAMTSSQTQLSPLSLAIIVLTLATALIHVALAIPVGLLMFYANALGYVALLAVIYLPLPALDRFGQLARYALIAYTAVTVLGWVAFGARDAIAYIDKGIEIVLIVMLFMETRKR